MATATSFSADATPALIEFSLLESWLASSGALQLPLHQIESQQQARAARSSAYSSKPTCSIAAMEIWDLLCNWNCQTVRRSILIAV